MQSEQMHCVSLSIYLSIHLSIYISLSRHICVYIFIYHSIYLSLYIIIIKRYCFQIEQLKIWKKYKILYFENDVILWWIYILIDISLWHPNFTWSPLYGIIFRVSIDEGLEKTKRYSILKSMSVYCAIWILIF